MAKNQKYTRLCITQPKIRSLWAHFRWKWISEQWGILRQCIFWKTKGIWLISTHVRTGYQKAIVHRGYRMQFTESWTKRTLRYRVSRFQKNTKFLIQKIQNITNRNRRTGFQKQIFVYFSFSLFSFASLSFFFWIIISVYRSLEVQSGSIFFSVLSE